MKGEMSDWHMCVGWGGDVWRGVTCRVMHSLFDVVKCNIRHYYICGSLYFWIIFVTLHVCTSMCMRGHVSGNACMYWMYYMT